MCKLIFCVKSGISLVDTPGLTSNRHHYDKTPEDDTVDKIIRKSESIFAVVWVLSSQNGFNQSFKVSACYFPLNSKIY